jgi:hypothetical protein
MTQRSKYYTLCIVHNNFDKLNAIDSSYYNNRVTLYSSNMCIGLFTLTLGDSLMQFYSHFVSVVEIQVYYANSVPSGFRITVDHEKYSLVKL